MARPRIAVLGGGLVGLGTAHALLRQRDHHVTIYEKEPDVGTHQSTHNSGVLHAGLYYAPGTHRASLARTGIRKLTAFCQEHGIAHEICGKLVVAADGSEVQRLRALHERGTKNGLRGLHWLDPAQAHEREPHVRCAAALHVPEEGIVDFRAVCDVLAREIRARDGVIRTRTLVTALERHGDEWRIVTPDGIETADIVVNCAAQHADRLARSAGATVNVRMVPFRGEYYHLRADREHLVNHLVYPVPDPAFPFLGVHFTRLIHGGREAGPNAVLAFSREGYRFTDFDTRDTLDSLRWPGFWRFLARHPRVTAHELRQSLSQQRFVRALQRLIPDVTEHDLERGGAGVRMQPLGRDGHLLTDFLWVEQQHALHVLSAPSPAATACLAIGEEIAARVQRMA